MTTFSNLKRLALAAAVVFALGLGVASAREFVPASGTILDKGPSFESRISDVEKYKDDHGGFGPGSDMPFMPGSN